MRVFSLFSGCGGLDLAFEKEGFEIVCAIDSDPYAVATYNANLEKVAQTVDVTTPDFTSLVERIEKVDVVVGGFPCQGFSKAGPKRVDDPRNKLYLAMVHAIAELQPKVFVAENVDGLNQNFSGAYLNKIKEDFGSLGYVVQERTFDAVGFGVPQHRRRTFIVGHRSGIDWDWMKYTHQFRSRVGEKRIEDDERDFQSRNAAQTIADAIGDLIELRGQVADHEIETIKSRDEAIASKIGAGQKLCNVRFADTSVYTWSIPEVFGEVDTTEILLLETVAKNRRKKIYGNIPNGNPIEILEIERLTEKDNLRGVAEKLVSKGYLKLVDGKYDLKGAMFCSGLYKRPNWKEPSPTVLTVFNSARYFLHPLRNRPFSVRECARLQSFPDAFSFHGSTREKYRQIGNAVPPVLAEAIVLSVKKALGICDRQLLAS